MEIASIVARANGVAIAIATEASRSRAATAGCPNR
jgi:hypothetical protein